MKILILMCFMSACYVFGDDCENGDVQILKRKPRLEMKCVKGKWIKKERRGGGGQPGAPPCQDDPAMAANGTCEADRAECLQFSEKGAKMDKDCPGTCESCDDCKCQDSYKWHRFCSYWAQYCQTPGVLGNWMSTNCRKTCGFCKCRCCSYQGKQHKLGAEILLPEKCSKLICKESLLGGQSPLLPGAAVHDVSHPEELTLEFVGVQDGFDCCLLPGDAVSEDGELKNGSMVAEGWNGKLNIDGRTLPVSCCHGILGVPLQDIPHGPPSPPPPATTASTTSTATSTPSTSVSTESPTCKSGWTLYHSSCYLYVATTLDWSSSQAACLAMSANLASIHDMGTNDFIAKLASSTSRVWIGGFQASGSAPWEWSDLSTWDFINWRTGEPNGSTENCLELYPQYAGDWNDQSCSDSLSYVCEKHWTA
eukprot:GFUD01015120.1.p1 GENE.GFUD01015120.1~~GFUD01015120.1.p1  ORF type:complete len:423 (-),score=74.35 GFUD01015120.1:253-1521(-)